MTILVFCLCLSTVSGDREDTPLLSMSFSISARTSMPPGDGAKHHTQRETTVFSSMNNRMDAMRDLADPTKDSRREPNGKKA